MTKPSGIISNLKLAFYHAIFPRQRLKNGLSLMLKMTRLLRCYLLVSNRLIKLTNKQQQFHAHIYTYLNRRERPLETNTIITIVECVLYSKALIQRSSAT